jgi:hypothetical protein
MLSGKCQVGLILDGDALRRESAKNSSTACPRLRLIGYNGAARLRGLR